jgi:hypothetical protein
MKYMHILLGLINYIEVDNIKDTLMLSELKESINLIFSYLGPVLISLLFFI